MRLHVWWNHLLALPLLQVVANTVLLDARVILKVAASDVTVLAHGEFIRQLHLLFRAAFSQ